jgi:hypothetical protein
MTQNTLFNPHETVPISTLPDDVVSASTTAPDVTAWPSDAPRTPFTVGGVYTFADVYGRQRTALVYTEQQARVDGSWWHVSELPADAVAVGTFTPDTALIADARRFVREVINSEQWS